MANILDYILWRGDLSIKAVPFNRIDNLILSNLAYISFKDIIPSINISKPSILKKALPFLKDKDSNGIALSDALDKIINSDKISLIKDENDVEMIKLISKTKRFGSMKLMYYNEEFNEAEEKQFACITFILDDDTAYIAFRGTDTTLVGWKEDFNMSFMDEVPSQKEALKYLNYVSSMINMPVRTGGHSKGGNLAVYAALHADKKIQDNIINIYNNDGPGFNSSVLETEQYKRLKDRIDTIVPQTSIIGMLLEHEEEYSVVKSSETFIMQHDPYSWQVLGSDFVYENDTTVSSKFVDNTLKNWLAGLNVSQREKLVEIIWDILSQTKVKSFSELNDKLFENAFIIVKSYKNLNDEERELLSQAWSLLKTSLKNSISSK